MTVINLRYLTGIPAQQIDKVAKYFLITSLFVMPISTAATSIFMGLTLVAWLLAGGFYARWEALKGNWFAFATVGLFLVVCLGTFYSTGSREDILFQLHKYAKLLFMLPAITLLQEEKWRKLGLMAFGGAMLLTLALSLISIFLPLPVFRGTAGGASDNHFVFRDHIAQNLMMSFFALVLLVKGHLDPGGRTKLVYLALGLLSIIDILFFVHGRTGYVSLLFNILVFFIFLSNWRSRAIAGIAFALIAITAVQLSPTFNSRVNRALTEYQEQGEKKLTSIGQRVEFIKKGIQLIEERPLIGFGTGSYKTEFCRVADTEEWCLAGRFHPHNQFIAFGVQLGLVGIMAYLIWLVVSLKQVLRLPLESKILGVGLLATLMVDSMFHAPLFLVAESAFFMLMLPLFMADVRQRT